MYIAVRREDLAGDGFAITIARIFQIIDKIDDVLHVAFNVAVRIVLPTLIVEVSS